MTKPILLIGHGAVAAEVRHYAERTGEYTIGAVLVRPERVEQVQTELGGSCRVIGSLDQLSFKPAVAAECASHSAVAAYGPALLRGGIDLIVASIGALAEDTLRLSLEQAATGGGSQLILPAGAVPGIDALNAALIGGLEEVSYISRKPPAAWKGTPAENNVMLDGLREPVVHYRGTARAAARDFPKNANVAATIALSGLGFDRTQVEMVADPRINENIHEISVRGVFGEMHVVVKGRPLQRNPKTSSLAAFSVIRAILNRVRVVNI